jgi:hypothetical protein
MTDTRELRPETELSEARRLGKRLEEMAWALFLIMTGALWLAPKAQVPEGTWLAGLGIILLGLNAARRLHGLKMSGFGLIIGSAALVAGIGRMLGRDLPYVPVLLIVLGTALVITAVVKRRKSDDVASAS